MLPQSRLDKGPTDIGTPELGRQMQRRDARLGRVRGVGVDRPVGEEELDRPI
jgi:hypothetical protein